MLTIGDVIQVVDAQSYLGEQMLNVYYYVCQVATSEEDNGLESFATAFLANVVQAVAAVQNVGVLHTSRTIKNISNGVDFFVDTTVQSGLINVAEGEWLPSYVSLGFMLVRSNLFTRNGYKRIGGLVEQFVSGNTSTYPQIDIDNIEEEFADGFTTLENDTFAPVIVKRPIPDPGTADPIINPIASSSFRGLGTQNTRKPGRGI